MESHGLCRLTDKSPLQYHPTSPSPSTHCPSPTTHLPPPSLLPHYPTPPTDSQTGDTTTPPPSNPRLRLSTTSSKSLVVIIGSLYLCTFLVAIDTCIIGTAIPAITTQFRALDAIAWFGSGYLLTLTALQPICGKLYKVLDTKGLYLGSLGVFEVGSILCAAAPSATIFVAGRAVAGCGAAGLMQGSFVIVTKTVPLAKRPFYFGLFVSAFGFSIGIGPVLGGSLADRGLWRWCFWINVPLGAIVTVLIAIFLKLESVHETEDCPTRSVKRIIVQLDLGGTILMIASVCCLLLAMQWGGQSLPWSSPNIVGLFTVSGILLVGFLVVEWKMGDDAAVPLSVLRQRSIAFGVVYLFFFSMPNFSYGIYIPMFFQAVKGFSAQRSGAEILSLALTQILVITATGALVSKSGYYTPFIIGGTALSIVGSGLIMLLDIDTPHAAWIAYFLICGGGTGAALNLPYTAVSAVLKEEDMVTGNALMQFAFQLGGAVSLSISQTIFLGGLSSAVRAQLPNLLVSDVVKAGAYNLPALASGVELQLLRSAYQHALRNDFMFLLVAAGLALLASFGFEHKNVRKVEEEQKRIEGSKIELEVVA